MAARYSVRFERPGLLLRSVAVGGRGRLGKDARRNKLVFSEAMSRDEQALSSKVRLESMLRLV